ncbi:MAG TPA: PLP-dependent aminotransferase family protein [Melioribacteraceae bacterium]|nr:PLP-dependent aminotransferase family protein [Melioribacteraceae bacterium]
MISFSKCVQEMRTSEIRDLMSVATRPDIISFAGGMPNNDLFPVKEIDEIYNTLSDRDKKTGFQYGPTPGYPPLIESVKEYLRSKNLPVDTNELMITSGSLQAINIVAKLFIDPGESVVTENPCFIGGTSAFKSYQANIESVDLDADGLLIDQLKEKFSSGKNPRLVYLSPYFHNPAGIVYSEKRKVELLEFLSGKETVLIEDDPYNELYFDEKSKSLTIPMKTIQPEPVPNCYIGSFSKILGPGMRLGWLLASPEIISKAQLAKQSIDACSSTFTQVLADQFLRQGKLKTYVENLRVIYKRRMNIMNDALKSNMPPEVKWVEPLGGFYIWVQLPDGVDSLDIMRESASRGAIFVIGKTFDPHGVKNNCFRLAFSHTPEDLIEKGVKIVAEAVKHKLK